MLLHDGIVLPQWGNEQVVNYCVDNLIDIYSPAPIQEGVWWKGSLLSGRYRLCSAGGFLSRTPSDIYLDNGN